MEIDVTQVITSLLAVIGSLIGTFTVISRKSKSDAIKEAEHDQAQKDQLESIFIEQQAIKDRLDKHNGYAEKFADTAKELALMNERQAQMAKDIEYLKTSIYNK